MISHLWTVLSLFYWDHEYKDYFNIKLEIKLCIKHSDLDSSLYPVKNVQRKMKLIKCTAMYNVHVQNIFCKTSKKKCFIPNSVKGFYKNWLLLLIKFLFNWNHELREYFQTNISHNKVGSRTFKIFNPKLSYCKKKKGKGRKLFYGFHMLWNLTLIVLG